MRTGYVTTILGRRRQFDPTAIRENSSYQQRNQAEREAINMEVQGSAADLIKLAMLNVFRRMRQEAWPLALAVADPRRTGFRGAARGAAAPGRAGSRGDDRRRWRNAWGCACRCESISPPGPTGWTWSLCDRQRRRNEWRNNETAGRNGPEQGARRRLVALAPGRPDTLSSDWSAASAAERARWRPNSPGGGASDPGRQFGHEALRQPDVREAILRRWGGELLDEQGEIQRRKLGAIVFSDPEERKALEALVHPWIRKRIEEEALRAKADAGRPADCFGCGHHAGGRLERRLRPIGVCGRPQRGSPGTGGSAAKLDADRPGGTRSWRSCP